MVALLCGIAGVAAAAVVFDMAYMQERWSILVLHLAVGLRVKFVRGEVDMVLWTERGTYRTTHANLVCFGRDLVEKAVFVKTRMRADWESGLNQQQKV